MIRFVLSRQDGSSYRKGVRLGGGAERARERPACARGLTDESGRRWGDSYVRKRVDGPLLKVSRELRKLGYKLRGLAIHVNPWGINPLADHGTHLGAVVGYTSWSR